MPTFYEDVTVGETTEHGSYDVTREEVLRFAERYDPQWFHTDPERAAAESPYGGVIASGWHTAAMTMRLLVESVLADAATVGAKGVDELRFRRPVRPGDSLRIETEILETVPERPDRGLVRARTRTFREGDRAGEGSGDEPPTSGESEDGGDAGEEVFSMVGNVMYLRREDAEE
ncbi:MaoC family dehydratase [Candidatus Halobonum tyrrellensis]|uniref:MaoC family protein n=1 Tax=Candidatus Halobonum tyrrellensis G22 TaxID=1324957 RepID=V4HIA3_9EURY|nr:MaoC family dehydratase [Candidatus Halobonum tyrrellensis]ESP89493.1 maoC family protein [Candidatus Halobonum tyrrellensis G22]